ncbi:MAG: UDP-N-acetylmuramoyl-L-alanyl-D-glutamate--2,6-diaminopimelate ligase [Candidatus Nanopelagicales bacterium]
MVRPTPVARPLGQLRDVLPIADEFADVTVTGISLDSRQIASGDLYAALAGEHHHGAAFASEAVAAGAVAILTDGQGQRVADELGVPVLVTDDPRALLGAVSAWIYGNPSESMTLIGVTGTDGKTTTTMFLEAALRGCGHPTGLIGTIVTRLNGEELPSVRTTPEAPDLQALLAVMHERGVTHVAMEVSSHALALGRVNAIDFDLAIFTNLGHDHLDFHRDQQHYFEAKAALFTPDHSRRALVCVDDEWGRELAARAAVPTYGYSVTEPMAALTPVGADWQAGQLIGSGVGWSYELTHPAGRVVAGTSVPGVFNVRNAVAATAAAVMVGCPMDTVIRSVREYPGAPGRMESVNAGQPFAVLVDYAHTPDAVERALLVGRETASRTDGRLLVLLGCGGDRDRAKRPKMGATAVRLADVVLITDDNPRSEDPGDIRREILAGAWAVTDGPVGTVVERAGREEALQEIVALAEPGDVVMALGKGHEVGQEIAGVVHPLDDRAVLRAALTPDPR